MINIISIGIVLYDGFNTLDAPNLPYNSGDPSVASPSALHFVSTHI